MSCPICAKVSAKEFSPFCSERCKMVDLGKWLIGSYTVPVVEMDDVELPEEGDGE